MPPAKIHHKLYSLMEQFRTERWLMHVALRLLPQLPWTGDQQKGKCSLWLRQVKEIEGLYSQPADPFLKLITRQLSRSQETGYLPPSLLLFRTAGTSEGKTKVQFRWMFWVGRCNRKQQWGMPKWESKPRASLWYLPWHWTQLRVLRFGHLIASTSKIHFWVTTTSWWHHPDK